jgi:membrane associated rhomboid family serine protease
LWVATLALSAFNSEVCVDWDRPDGYDEFTGLQTLQRANRISPVVEWEGVVLLVDGCILHEVVWHVLFNMEFLLQSLPCKYAVLHPKVYGKVDVS